MWNIKNNEEIMDAKTAREISNKNYKEIQERRKNALLKLISQATKQGSYQIKVDYDLSNKNQKFFEDLGYRFSHCPFTGLYNNIMVRTYRSNKRRIS